MNKQSKELLEGLIEACGYGLLEPAQRFIKDGANVNGNQDGFTPLISSIYGQNIELLEFLVQSGADVNQGSQTAMHEAFDCLLANMRDENQKEPDIEELRMIELLIQHGADVDKTNQDGKTPLESLNQFATDQEDFERMKGFFRPFIPDIDSKIEFKPKD